jgi:hypothetical protein
VMMGTAKSTRFASRAPLANFFRAENAKIAAKTRTLGVVPPYAASATWALTAALVRRRAQNVQKVISETTLPQRVDVSLVLLGPITKTGRTARAVKEGTIRFSRVKRNAIPVCGARTARRELLNASLAQKGTTATARGWRVRSCALRPVTATWKDLLLFSIGSFAPKALSVHKALKKLICAPLELLTT